METTETTTIKDELIAGMFSAGAHFAYSKSRRHPSANPYIFGVKNSVEIFDLEKTKQLLEEAKAFVASLAKEGKQILFVAGKNEAREVVRNTALSINMPYVTGRWIGGALTNFSEIKKRIARYEELSADREKGELAKKYTKKEQVLIGREIESLEASFAGLTPMKELPGALFVIDTKREHIAVAEAKKRGVPVIALMNSDCDGADATYPILANDGTVASITFFVKEIANTYTDNKTIQK
jgi:small subunit ribosomal protein S2